MDIATYIGLAFGLLVIGAAVLTGSDFWVFLNLPGFLIVVAGSFAATLIRYPISGVLTAFAVGARAAFSSATDSKPRDPIVKALELTQPHNGRVAMPLRNEFDSAKSRMEYFRNHPAFLKKITLTRRPKWSDIDKASPRHNFAWFVWCWAKDPGTKPVIEWAP
mgnify:CR=1 FL=1